MCLTTYWLHTFSWYESVEHTFTLIRVYMYSQRLLSLLKQVLFVTMRM